MKTLLVAAALLAAATLHADAIDNNVQPNIAVTTDASAVFAVHHCGKYVLPEGGVDIEACFADPTTVDGYVPPTTADLQLPEELLTVASFPICPKPVTQTQVPEPGTLSLLAGGVLVGLSKLKRE